MRPVSNLTIAAHAWAALIDKCNEMAYIFSTDAVTLFANTAGATTTGNGHVNGYFSANLIIAKDGLRGGTLEVPAALIVTSNAVFNANIAANGVLLSASANVSLTGANLSVTGSQTTISSNVSLTGANTSIAGTNTAISSNINVSGAVSRFTGANVHVTGTNLVVSSNLIATGANISIVATNTTITGNVNVIGSITSFAGPSLTSTANVTVTAANVLFTVTNTNITGAVTVGGLSTLAAANITGTTDLRANTTAFANITASSNTVQVGNTTGRFIFVGNSLNLSSTLTVDGISTFNANVIAPTANINVVAVGNTVDIVGFTNTNLGSNVTHNRLITTFSGSSYRSGKVALQFVDTTNNAQKSELWFTSNTTAVDYTVTGTLYNGTTQPVSNTVAVWNAGTIEIYAVQAAANTAVKGIAELVKG